MSAKRIIRQYGLWDSPITPLSLTRGIRLSDVAWDEDGTLAWLEGRPERSVVVLQPPTGEAIRDLNDQYSIRARLGYGGGDFTIGKGDAYFVAADSGRIYRQPLQAGAAYPITPAFGRAAAPKLSPNGRWVVFVHSYEDQDSLAIVDSLGKSWPQKLVSGEDFYMQPTWHPDGQQIAWIAWNHPNMPWDGTRLTMANLSFQQGRLPAAAEVFTINGDEHTSIFQPEFSPDGRHLAYVSDQSGWWHIYLYDLQNGNHRPLTEGDAEHGSPAWVQGMRTFNFSPDGKSLFFIRNQGGSATLWQADISSGRATCLEMGDEYTWLEQIAAAPDGERLALIASAGRTPTRLVVYNLPQGRLMGGNLRIIRRSTAEDQPAETYSHPRVIEWASPDGGKVHGVYYPPHNPAFESRGLPPLIVLVHGGPTSQRTTAFDSQVQFFTSRGFAVLLVNHRGSTGYGRAYRDMLRGNWGIYDVQDSVSGLRYLAGKKLVDEHRAVIMGGSAGGYTVLKALQDFPDTFKAGINLYGISNQLTSAIHMHKFEAHYSDSLLGPLPDAAEVYRQRSPIFFADAIRVPLAIFHGEDDEVVSLSNSEELAATLKRKGVPHIFHVYAGEGHGFRKPETILHLYSEIENFVKQYVIYT